MGYYVRVEPNVTIYVEDINPYGAEKEDIIKIIQGTDNDRPKMLRDFGDIFFFQNISQALSDWFFQLGLQAAGWATAAIANTWIDEVLFSDLRK